MTVEGEEWLLMLPVPHTKHTHSVLMTFCECYSISNKYSELQWFYFSLTDSHVYSCQPPHSGKDNIPAQLCTRLMTMSIPLIFLFTCNLAKKQTKKKTLAPSFIRSTRFLLKIGVATVVHVPKKKKIYLYSEAFHNIQSRCVAPSNQICGLFFLCMLLFPGLANCWLGNAQSWPSAGSRPRAANWDAHSGWGRHS